MSGDILIESLYTEELYQITLKHAIVITQPWNEIKKEEKEQLVKITEVLRQKINPGLGLGSFKLITVPALDLSTWKEKPQKLIYFGPPLKGLPLYEVIAAGSTQMVLSGSLSDLISDEGLRAKLWTALKQLFAV